MSGGSRVGTWVFLAADAMLFASLLFVALYLRARGGAWGDARPALVPEVVLLGVLAACGLSASLLSRRPALAVTAFLALAYVAGQTLALAPAVRAIGSPLASAFLALMAAHALHVLAAAASLLLPGGRERAAGVAALLHLLFGVRVAAFVLGRLP